MGNFRWAALIMFVLLLGLPSLAMKENARDLKKDSDGPTMDDLNQLRDQKKWAQLSAQLERIPTALRTDSWNKLLNATALALTEDADKAEVPTQVYLESDDLLIRYPDLGKNSEFMRRRRVAGLKFFENCYQNKNNTNLCTTRLKSFADVDPDDADLQYGTGKLIRSHVGPLDAIPYFSRAMPDRAREAWCKDSDVKLAITSGLSLPPGKQGENVEAIKDSVHVAFNVCWGEWNEVLQEMYAKEKTHYQHNTCSQLRARGVLTVTQARACPRKAKE